MTRKSCSYLVCLLACPLRGLRAGAFPTTQTVRFTSTIRKLVGSRRRQGFSDLQRQVLAIDANLFHNFLRAV